MALIDILLPAMGEGVIEATITQILAKVGAEVEEDDSIIEIATDKVDSEIPAPENGIISELFVNEGDTVKVGQLIAKLKTDGEEVEVKSKSESKTKEILVEEKVEEEVIQAVESDVSEKQIIESTTSSNKFLSPLVRSIMSKESVSVEEVDKINGTGAENRITKDDILAYIEQRKSGAVIVPQKEVISTPVPIQNTIKTPVSVASGDEIIEMDRMRKLIAEHMVNSIRTAPHVTSFVEADLTAIVNWRNKYKDDFLKREGEKLTFMPIFVEAMAKAIKDFPMINVSVDGTTIIKKKDINIGMAAALPSGNLIVPVIRKADEKNLVGLAKNINDLANRSRKNKLKPDEIQGSTITITNLGSFGNIAGTPIINQPNVAILAVGAIVKKPAVIETSEGDAIAIRHKMMLSLAYDHRVVDGALGGMFLKRVGDYLENFNTDRKA